MPSAGITIVVLVILGLAIGVPSFEWWKTSKDLRVCNSDFEAFEAKTTALGLQAQLRVSALEAQHKANNAKIEGDLNAKQSDLDRVYADNARLRKQAADRASSGAIIQRLQDAASRFNCTDPAAGLAGRLERLEAGVLERLAKPRDEAVLRTIACKEYLEAEAAAAVQQ